MLYTLQEEKAFSEDQSALVSTAYATLRQPLKRAIYLVRACALQPPAQLAVLQGTPDLA